jgi:hypothetical protein
MQAASDGATDTTAEYRDQSWQVHASLGVPRLAPRKKPEPETNGRAYNDSGNQMGVFGIFGSHLADARSTVGDKTAEAGAAVRASELHIRHIPQITLMAPSSDDT